MFDKFQEIVDNYLLLNIFIMCKMMGAFLKPLNLFSLTEVYFLRVLMGHQRVDTETHTKREAARWDARPEITKATPKKHHVCYETPVILICFTFSTRGPQ